MTDKLSQFGWIRILKITMGVGFVALGLVMQDNIASILGAMLLFQGIFNLNFCMTGACITPIKNDNSTQQNNTIVYEEVKPKK